MHYAEDHHVHQLLVLLLVVQQQVHTIPTRNAASMQYYLAALPKSNYIQAQKHQHLWHKHAAKGIRAEHHFLVAKGGDYLYRR
jgi:hypothetical protein